MARVKNNHKFLDFDAIDGRKHMMDAIEEMTPGNTPLVLDIGDEDPDDSYSSIAYEKGFTLLLYLERLIFFQGVRASIFFSYFDSTVRRIEGFFHALF